MHHLRSQALAGFHKRAQEQAELPPSIGFLPLWHANALARIATHFTEARMFRYDPSCCPPPPPWRYIHHCTALARKFLLCAGRSAKRRWWSRRVTAAG